MEKKKEFIINTMFWVLIAVLAYLFFKFVFPELIPFVTGFIMAYFVRFVAKKISGNSEETRKVLTLVITIVIYVLLFSLIIGVGVKLIDEIKNLIQSLPAFYGATIVPLWQLFAKTAQDVAMEFDESVAIEVQNTINDIQASMGKYISDISLSVVSILSNGIVGIPGLLVKVIITVVSTFFMATDFDKVIGLARSILGEKTYEMVNSGLFHTKKVIGAYLKSYTLLFLLTFVELSIGLSLFRIPYAILIAALIAIFDILPVLGTGGVLIPWSIICLIIGKTPLGIGIFILYIIITAIRNTLEPKIVGKQIGLHPLATLMAMIVGMGLFGLAGLIFCPVALVVLVSMAKAGAIKFKGAEEITE